MDDPETDLARCWRIESDRTVFAAEPWLAVSRQAVRIAPDRVIEDYHQIRTPDFSIACALTPEREVLTLWQYKHGARQYGLTFPAGAIEAGEDPAEAMRRELYEETGYVCKEVRPLGAYVTSANQRGSVAHMFLMCDCVKVAEPASGDLEAMELRVMTGAAVDRAMRERDVVALPNVAIWALAKLLCPDAF